MHKTIYIDIDEEITSIVERIRREGAPDIFLVVPKNAMLVQGMLNLKILKKEAEILHKNVMLVTNDKFAKKVIERTGLMISEKPVPDEPAVSTKEKTTEEISDVAAREAAQKIAAIEKDVDSDRSIGTATFYDGSVPRQEPSQGKPLELSTDQIKNQLYATKSIQPKPEPSFRTNPAAAVARPQPQKLPINPQIRKQPANFVPPINPSKNAVRSSGLPTHIPKHLAVNNRDVVTADLFGNRRPQEQNVPISKGLHMERDWNSKKAEEFFLSESEPAEQKIPEREKFQPQNQTRKPKFKLKFRWWTLLPISAVCAVIIAFWSYKNFPRAEITIWPAEKTQQVNFDLVGKTDINASNSDLAEIPVALEEVEVTKSSQFEATGEKFSSDSGKARGKVKITNNYSSSPQTLVATTRIVSQDNKLFRLVDQVTVPGMKDGQPGQVEATVVADKPGEEYNIGPSKFNIAGFKGGPKYDKFEVVSDQPMTGGNNSNDNKVVKMVTAGDIETARQKTMDDLDDSLDELVMSKITPGKVGLIESADKEIVGSSTSQKEGDIADKFEFSVTEKIKLLTFFEDDILKIAEGKLEEKNTPGYSLKSFSPIEYDSSSADYSTSILSLKVKLSGVFKPDIDAENIKTGIAGKNEQDISKVLSGNPEIKKAQIKFAPAWLSNLPVTADKISVILNN